MEFVEIKGISKRRKRPVILTVEQFFLILPLIPQPYRMMVLLAQCSGLRVEEVLAIEKPDIHFGKLSMQIVRAVVHGRLKLVKTEYSEDELPLDPDLAATVAIDFAHPTTAAPAAGSPAAQSTAVLGEREEMTAKAASETMAGSTPEAGEARRGGGAQAVSDQQPKQAGKSNPMANRLEVGTTACTSRSRTRPIWPW